VRYALSSGGKRLRPLLVLEGYRAAGGTGDAAHVAAAVEIVHAYSLVHDDLPCMDDDDMRRGQPATHRVFGVGVAAAAGAAMIPLAARAAWRGAALLRLPDAACGMIVKVLMRAAGAGGMIGGQHLDLSGEGRALTQADLDAVHGAKTGALISASVKIGAIAADSGDDAADALATYGDCIGLAFQIMDDVLDVTASSVQLGKTAGRDAELRKSTYPSLLGVDGAVAKAQSLVAEACDALRKAGISTGELEKLAGFIVSRTH
jgi:geranylgeranyl pyrophosphate synthase